MSHLDDQLLKRFQALRAPTDIPSGTVHTLQRAVQKRQHEAKKEDQELDAIADGRALPEVSILLPPGNSSDRTDADLTKRLKSLRGEESEYQEHEIADDDVEAYLSALSSSDPPDEVNDAAIRAEDPSHHLSKDADEALRAAAPHLPDDDRGTSDGETDEGNHEETEEEIVAKALAEASLDRAASPADQVDPPIDEEQERGDVNFVFPSLPTHAPEPDVEPVGEDAKKRMDQLLGLSFPTSQPGNLPELPTVPKREVGQGWNLPGYHDARDNDLDSWCCICNKDADLVCLGCDDDMYCTECWRDGHEFEKHRVKKFNWGRQKAIGA